VSEKNPGAQGALTDQTLLFDLYDLRNEIDGKIERLETMVSDLKVR
jgi:hypothetical protein